MRQMPGNEIKRRPIMDKNAEVQAVNERRQHPHLRDIYLDARLHIDHFFHQRHDWAVTPVDVLAQRVIHETYPHLASADIRLLVSAIERMHQTLADQEARHQEARH